MAVENKFQNIELIDWIEPHSLIDHRAKELLAHLLDARFASVGLGVGRTSKVGICNGRRTVFDCVDLSLANAVLNAALCVKIINAQSRVRFVFGEFVEIRYFEPCQRYLVIEANRDT